MTAEFSGPGTITLSLNLHQFVEDYYGAGLGDQIVAAAAQLIVTDISKDVRKQVSATIETQVGQIVTEALTTGFRKVNTWGEPTGEPTTLRESIAAEAQAWFSKPIGDSYSRGPAKTAVQKFIETEVDKQIKSELNAALTAAKAQVLERVKDQAAAVIADTITRTAAAR
jgi:uncharacterized membrane-anchored protein YjiN (DUF445 family)